MKILVVGSGGREHAIIKKIKENPTVEKIYAVPGNGGIAKDAECVNIGAKDIEAIAKFATENKIDYAVVAPDDPLVLGCVDALEKVCEHQGIRLIGLTGPTCSGKTTTAKKLISYLTAQGKNVHVVSIDDFYLDREVLIARANDDPDVEIDYDSEDTIDFDALKKCIDEVFTDEPTKIPKYDFVEGRRVGYITIDPDENDLFIFEGIQAIYPKVTELFHKYNYKEINQ